MNSHSGMRYVRCVLPRSAAVAVFVLCLVAMTGWYGIASAANQSQRPVVVAQVDGGTTDARAMVQLINQIEGLNRELSKLRGKVEELNNSIVNAEKRQKDMYLDLDTRLRRVESSGSNAEAESAKATESLNALKARVEKLEQTAATGASSMSTPDPKPASSVLSAGTNAEVNRSYEAAMSKYRGRLYQEAIDAFQVIVQQHPQHPLAVNAQYWTGDSYYQLRAYRSAIDAQKQLIAQYPNGAKVPDAMLNMGSAHIGLGDKTTARQLWEQLIATYPGTQAAANAKERLEQLP